MDSTGGCQHPPKVDGAQNPLMLLATMCRYGCDAKLLSRIIITVLSGKNQAHLQVATRKHGSVLAMLDSHINVPVLVTQLELLSTWCRIKKYEIRVPAVISALHLVSNLRL